MLKKVLSLLFVAMIAQPVLAAEPAPDFTLAKSDGGKIALSKLRGQVVYVDFWATWCPPCRKSFPWMEEMHKRYQKQGLRVVAISLDKAQEPVKKFLKEMRPSFAIALDPDGATADRFKVSVMPTSYLIDRKGNIQKVHHGFRSRDTDKLEAEIKKLLAK